MKKNLLLFFMLFTSAALFAAPLRAGSKVYVSVKDSSLKSDQSSISKTVTNLSYGDCLVVVEAGEKKTKVTLAGDPSLEGWVLNSHFTTKKILANNSGRADASSDELALAGKGFSEEAENAFRSANSSLDYKTVDAIEKISVNRNELMDFISQGHLKGGEE